MSLETVLSLLAALGLAALVGLFGRRGGPSKETNEVVVDLKEKADELARKKREAAAAAARADAAADRRLPLKERARAALARARRVLGSGR